MQFGPGLLVTFLYYFSSTAVIFTLVVSRGMGLGTETGIPQAIGVAGGLLAGGIGAYFNRTVSWALPLKHKKKTLIELENEKAVAPIPSTADGVISKLHVKEGAKISVGALIVSIEGAGEGAAPADAPAAKASAPKARKKAAPVVVEEEEEADDESGDEGE